MMTNQPNNIQPNSFSRVAIYSLMFIAIVGLGIASRFWLVDFPNFKPVAALVLFGGFFFRKAWIAVAALFSIMLISDLQLGVYQWQLAAMVYASLALSCGLGIWAKRSVESSRRDDLLIPMGPQQIGRFLVASLVMSTAFYVLTNGAVWAAGAWYPKTGEGLLACYSAGIPFYRATLIGDLFFTTTLVGSYCLVQHFVVFKAKTHSRFGFNQAN